MARQRTAGDDQDDFSNAPDFGMGGAPDPSVLKLDAPDPRQAPNGEESGGLGNPERPREVPGPGRDTPGMPVDAHPRPAPGGGMDSGGGGGDYTPARPKAPSPVSAAPPMPFSPMAPMMDPGAMSVAMRSPYTPEPTSQYGGDEFGSGLLGSSEGLLGGGMGLTNRDDSFEDTEGDPLDALIRMLMQGGGGQ